MRALRSLAGAAGLGLLFVASAAVSMAVWMVVSYVALGAR